MTDKIIIKHRYTDAVLFEFQPTNEQQSSGLAMCVALEVATKGGAYLGDANLRGAYLGGAYLRGERPIFSVGPIGSRDDFFFAYITDKGLRLRAGYFFGTIPEFEEKLQTEHGDNIHAREYRAALALIYAHAELWTPAVEAQEAEADQ